MGRNLKWFGRHPKYFKRIILEILSSWTPSTKWRAYFSPKNCWQEANWENSSNVSMWLLSVMKSKGWYRQQKQKNKGWNVSTKETSDLLFCTYSVQFSSVTQLCPMLCDPWIIAYHASLSITNSRSPPKPMPIKSVMAFSHLILCHPLLLLPPTPPSIRVFSNESTLRMRWPKYWSFSFNISPSNEHPGLISFRVDWLDLLAVQGTLKSLLQHHNSKAYIFQHSAFFIVQLSHPYMTTGKTIALTRWTFVGKVLSLLFNMLSRLVITFLPRSKHLLISWLQSPSAAILVNPI